MVGILVLAGFVPRTKNAVATSVVVVGAVLLRPPVLTVVVVGVLCGVAFLMRSVGREHMQRRERSNLPELADAIALSLNGGATLAVALDDSAHLAGRQLGTRLGSMADALRHGIPVGEVMAGPGHGVEDRDHEIAILMAALEIGADHTMQRSRVLVDAGVSLRLRRLRREDMTAQAAQARTSAVVVTVSPWAVAAMSAVADPEHIQRLTSPYGRWCVVGAAVLTMVGAATMRGMIRRSGLS